MLHVTLTDIRFVVYLSHYSAFRKYSYLDLFNIVLQTEFKMDSIVVFTHLHTIHHNDKVKTFLHIY